MHKNERSFIGNKYIYFLFSIILVLSSCKENEVTPLTNEVKENPSVVEWTKNATIYGVNIKQFTSEGTINAFSNHIPRLKDMGISAIQLAPFFATSLNDDHQTNSIYAVSNFNTIDPALGTKKDLINLIKKIQAYKIKVLLEWSTDFTSTEHNWYKNFPEYYISDASAMSDSLINQDLFSAVSCSSIGILNFENQAIQDSMIALMSSWITNYKVNGFVFNSIYKKNFVQKAAESLSALDSNLLIISQGSNYIRGNNNNTIIDFDRQLFSLMNDVANNRKSMQSVKHKIDASSKLQNPKINYVTSYLENVLNGSEIERFGEAYQAFIVLMNTIEGINYMHNGQEEPMQKRLTFCDENKINFKNYGAMRFYKDLIKLNKENKALWNYPYGGKLKFLQNHDQILVFKRMKDDDLVYVIINMSNQEQKLQVSEPIRNVIDIFTKQKVNHKKGEIIKLDPWEFIIGVK